MPSPLLLTAWLTLSGCADPHDAVLPPSPIALAANPDFQATMQKLDQAERESLARYYLRSMMSGGVPAGTTIGAALDAQQQFEVAEAAREAEAKALAAKLEAERAALRATFDAAVTVAMVDKQFREANWRAGRYQDTIDLVLGLQNKSDKDIAGVKGAIVFKDLFGTVVKRIGIAYDDGLAAGATRRWNGSVDYNPFMDDDRKLATTPLDKLVSTFEPDAIVFADGTRLEMPTAADGL